MNKTIRVLVVDDSVLARTMITQGLAKSPRIEIVGTAFNAVDALAKVAQVKPDVITSDIEMPGMNGMEFLKKLLPKYPLPVILVSSLNLRVFDALSAGAVDFVRKPEPGQNEAFIAALTQKVIAAAGAKVHSQRAPAGSEALPGSGDHRAGGLHGRHGGHAGGIEAPARRHPGDADRPAHAHGLYRHVRRPAEPPVPDGGAGGQER